MSDKKVEMKAEKTMKMETGNSKAARQDADTTQVVGANQPSSTLSPAELEYALARPA